MSDAAPRPTVHPRTLNLEETEARRILREEYGCEAERLTRFDSELSTVFRVECAGPAECTATRERATSLERATSAEQATSAEHATPAPAGGASLGPAGEETVLALKAVPDTADTAEIFAWQVEIAELLAANGVPCGDTVRTLSGNRLARVHTSAGEAAVHLGTWLFGGHLSAELSPAVRARARREMIELAATVSRVLADAPQPPRPVSHPWELVRTRETLETALPQLRDPEAAALVATALKRFTQRVEPVLATLPQQVVHHDLHEGNVLIHPDTGEVCGVLDFGDAVWGPRVAEIGTMAAYLCRQASDPGNDEASDPARDEASDPARELERIAREYPGALTPAERALIPEIAIARFAVSAGLWGARSGGERDAYARSRSGRTLEVLKKLLASDPPAVEEE